MNTCHITRETPALSKVWKGSLIRKIARAQNHAKHCLLSYVAFIVGTLLFPNNRCLCSGSFISQYKRNEAVTQRRCIRVRYILSEKWMIYLAITEITYSASVEPMCSCSLHLYATVIAGGQVLLRMYLFGMRNETTEDYHFAFFTYCIYFTKAIITTNSCYYFNFILRYYKVLGGYYQGKERPPTFCFIVTQQM